jgi:hypothetical protein
VFYYLILSDLDLVKISKESGVNLFKLTNNENHCLSDALFSFDNMI